jgi:hypothetical protein
MSNNKREQTDYISGCCMASVKEIKTKEEVKLICMNCNKVLRNEVK